MRQAFLGGVRRYLDQNGPKFSGWGDPLADPLVFRDLFTPKRRRRRIERVIPYTRTT